MSRRAIARPAIRRVVAAASPGLERLALLPDRAIASRSGKRFGGVGSVVIGRSGAGRAAVTGARRARATLRPP